jgi:hypothetical protein
MKVTTGVNASGTCLQGYLEGISFWELVDIFGEPEGPGGDGKTRANWSIQLDDGDTVHICTIYDWKTDEPLTEIRKWNVGGNNPIDYLTLNSYIGTQLDIIRNGSILGSDCQV